MQKYLLVILLLVTQILSQNRFNSYSNIQVMKLKNPERGYANSRSNYNEDELSKMDETVIFMYYYYKDNKEGPLNDWRIDELRRNFETLRKYGKKIVIRFAYAEEKESDAKIEIVSQHIQKLSSVINENKDTILTVQAGFIGFWGEWHNSANNLSGKAVLDLLVKYFQPIISLRYPMDKYELISSKPTTAADVVSNSLKARIGFHNDGMLHNNHERGTFSGRGKLTDDQVKKYLESDSKYVIMGGEPHPGGEDFDPYMFVCTNALKILPLYHYTYISIYFPFNVVSSDNLWVKQGCFEEVREKLGYVLFLRESNLSHSVYNVNAKQALRYSFRIENKGWAAPVNNRPIQLVFVSGSTSVFIPLSKYPSLKTWYSGTTITVSGTIAANSMLSRFRSHVGKTFDVRLRLPDSSARLSSNPKYSIGFVNQGVYDPNSGLNSSFLKLKISTSNTLDVEEDTLFDDSE